MGALRPYLSGPAKLHGYGWTGLLGLSCTNRRAVRKILPHINPGDFLIGHSNGALLCWELAEMLGGTLGGVVVINPALRRDTLWQKDVPVLCLYNSKDWVVQLVRGWGRLIPDGVRTAGWGAAGRYGFTHDQHVEHVDTSMSWWGQPVAGHSAVFDDPPVVPYWGGVINRWKRLTEAGCNAG